MASAAPRKDHAKPDSPWRSRPRGQVVGRHRGGEAGLLGVLDVAQERGRGRSARGSSGIRWWASVHATTSRVRSGGGTVHGCLSRRPRAEAPHGPAVGRSRHGPPGGRRRRRGLGHGRWHHRVGAGPARGRRAAARARRAAAAGAGELVAGRGVHPPPLQAGRAVGGRRRVGLRARGCTTWSGATRRSTGRRCRGSGSRTSRRSRTSTASRPRGRSATPTWSPTTARPSGCTPCTGAPARTPPSRGAARRSRTPRCRTSRTWPRWWSGCGRPG